MSMRSKQMLMVFLAGMLASCGGDGGPGIATVPPVTYADYAGQDAALRSTWAAAPPTDPASLPVSGSASYAGVMVLDAEVVSGVLPLTGALGLQADFASATMSGQARGFRDASNTAYQGQLVLANGVLDRGADINSAYTFGADLAGVISGGGDSFDVTATLQGDFLDAGQQAVSGVVTGSAVSSFGTGFIYGDFIASQ